MEGSVTGAAAMAAIGCTSGPRPRAGADDPALAGHLRSCDAALALATATSPVRLALPGLGAAPLPGALAPQESVQISTMRAGIVTGWFRGLPEPLQAHPEVQSRVHAVFGDMQASVTGTSAYLSSLDPAEIRSRAGVLRAHPEVARRLEDGLREQLAVAGVSPALRAAFVRAKREAFRRLTESNPVAAVQQELRTVHRVARVNGAQAEFERELAAEHARAALFDAPASTAHARVALQSGYGRYRYSDYEGGGWGQGRSWRGLLKASGTLFAISLAFTGLAFGLPVESGAVVLAGAIIMGIISLALLIAGLISRGARG